MRVLIVSPWLPYANMLHAGGEYLYQMLKSLSSRHDLHLICYQRDETSEQIAALDHLCQTFTLVKPAYSWEQKWQQLLKDGWRHPFRLGKRAHFQVQQAIQAICHDHHIDVVHLVWTEMGRYLDIVPSQVGTVLHTLDTEYLVRPLEVALYPDGQEKQQACRRMEKLINIERESLSKADVVIAASKSDKVAFTRLNDQMPIIVATPWIGYIPDDVQISTIKTGQLTFMGAMDRIANQAAVNFLVDDVWHLICDQYPYITLKIVGANPPDSLIQRCQDDSRIVVTGYCADLPSVWMETDIAVSPSIIGGGLLIKIAQPMAWGRPVVTTSLGNQGVAAQPETAIEVQDNPQGFAAAIGCLLDDRSYWLKLATNGQHHVRGHLNWKTSIEAIEEAYQLAVERSILRIHQVQGEVKL